MSSGVLRSSGNASESLNCGQQPKALYSQINSPKNIYEINTLILSDKFIETIKKQALSVACMVKNYLIKDDSGGYKLSSSTRTLQQYQESKHQVPFGENEAWGKEYVIALSTVFLVGKQLVLTARHSVCLENSDVIDKKSIDNTYILFGYQMTQANQSHFKFQEKDVYKIKKVVACSKLNEDWSLLKLDRDVEGRDPLVTNFLTKVVKKTELYMEGHPLGLPMKFAGGAEVKACKSSYFEADLDAFGGNSGSPVFDKNNNQVIGILVRGHLDYEVTSNYQNTGQPRVQLHRVTDAEILAHGYERVQMLCTLNFVKNYILAQQGDLDAQYEVGLSYYNGKEVPKNKEKGLKLLQKIASQGKNLTKITCESLYELFAKEILLFGPRALESQRKTKIGNAIAGTTVTLLSLPLLGLPAAFVMYQIVKSEKSKKFELLALDDPRFQLFVHLANNNIDAADNEFKKYESFFTTYMKTQTFLKDFIDCLKNCDNLNYDSDYINEDIKRGNNYINFFVEKKVIPESFTKYRSKKIYHKV